MVARLSALALISLLSGLNPAPDRVPALGQDNPDVERRYRIVGAVRILLVWMSADDVGGARISWRQSGGNRTLSLLIGSDPRRAPRHVNEWGYTRESTSGEVTSVFGIRTLSADDSREAAERRQAEAGGQKPFGVLCSTVTSDGVSSQTATVRVARNPTYRDVALVMDALDAGVAWRPRSGSRPAGTSPGFLTALDDVMRATAAQAASNAARPTIPPATYVYRDAVFDLTARDVERVAQLRTRSGRLLRDLVKAKFVVTNRAARSTTDFWLTFGTEGELAGVPVHARYQPNWWFRVELHLDESADAPRDPAAEPSVLDRIESVCQPGNR